MVQSHIIFVQSERHNLTGLDALSYFRMASALFATLPRKSLARFPFRRDFTVLNGTMETSEQTWLPTIRLQWTACTDIWDTLAMRPSRSCSRKDSLLDSDWIAQLSPLSANRV